MADMLEKFASDRVDRRTHLSSTKRKVSSQGIPGDNRGDDRGETLSSFS